MNNSQWTRGNRPKTPQGEYLLTVEITEYFVTQAQIESGARGEPRTERIVCDGFYKPGEGWYTGGYPRKETADNKVIAWMRKPQPYSG